MLLREFLTSDVVLKQANESITIAAGDMSFSADKKHGNFIVGPLSITSAFTNIKFSSGLFRFNSLLASTMPSTIVTPVPVFEFEMPTKALSGLQSVSKMILSTVSEPTRTIGIRG